MLGHPLLTLSYLGGMVGGVACFGQFFPCCTVGATNVPGGSLGATSEFCGAFVWTMSFETCPKRVCLAVLGCFLLTLSYFGRGVGLSKFHRDSGTEYFRGCTECPGGVTWRHR